MADAVREIEIRADTRQATAELAKASRATKEAEKALDGYRDATSTLGGIFGRAGAEQAKLTNAITASRSALDAANKSVDKARAKLAQYAAAADASGKELSQLRRELAQLERAAGQANKSHTSLTKGADGAKLSFSSLKTAFAASTSTLTMMGGGLAAAGEWLLDSAKKSANLKAATQALKISLDEARKSTLGLVDDLTLTVAANKAVTAGVVTTGAEFGRLADAATKLGLAAGKDAAGSLEELTLALATGSSEVLNNFGIILKQEQAYEEYAKKIGVVVSALTDEQKARAFMVVGLEKAIQTADNMNVSLDRTDVALQQAAVWLNKAADAVGWAFSKAVGGALLAVEDLSVGVYDLTRSLLGLEEKGLSVIQKAQLQILQTQTKSKESIDIMWEAVTLADALQVDITEIAKNTPDPKDQLATLKKIAEERDAAFSADPANAMKPDLFDFEYAKKMEAEKEAAQKVYDDAVKAVEAADAEAAKKAAAAAKKAADEKKKIIEENEKAIQELFQSSHKAALEDDEEALQAALDLLTQYGELSIAETARIQAQAVADSQQTIEAQAVTAQEAQSAALAAELADAQEARLRRKAILDQEVRDRQEASLRLRATTQMAGADMASFMEKGAGAISKAGGKIGDVMAATTIAALDSAKGQKKAAAIALAAQLKSWRNLMIAQTLKETALGIASLAGVATIPLAAGHFVAAAQAGAAAIAIGTLGAIVGERAESGGSPAASSGAQASSTSSDAAAAKNTPDPAKKLDVPVSDDSTTKGIRNVPKDPKIIQIVLQNPQFIGSDIESAGRMIKKALKAAEGKN